MMIFLVILLSIYARLSDCFKFNIVDRGVQPLDVNYDTKVIVDRIRNQSSRYQHSNSLATDKTPLVCIYCILPSCFMLIR